MQISPTSSLFGDIREEPSARRLALLDELEKIAEEKKRDPKWKRIAKTTGVAALGYAAGHGAGMLADAAARKVFKDRYPQLSPDFKKYVLYPLLGVSMMGVSLAAAHANEQRERLLRGE